MRIRIDSPARLSVHLLLALCLLLITALPAATQIAPRTLRIDPALQALLPQMDAPISVIVQKTGSGMEAEALVESLGGRVLKTWTIIPAFLAEMSAEAVQQLAGNNLVRWISYNSPLQAQEREQREPEWTSFGTMFNYTIGATNAWNAGFQGQGVTVAVVDSGINGSLNDFNTKWYSWWPTSRIVAHESFGELFNALTYSTQPEETEDQFGHGTHVAGIIGGNGASSWGLYMGVAPKVNLVNLRVANRQGMAYEADMVDALQWIYDHRDEHNIRVVNVSINSATPQSYHTSPLDAALEILWFDGIVVVASAGNNGAGSDNGILYPPANDPFVITVGAADDKGNWYPWDDIICPFSAYGTTESGFAKPELVAPGAHIISLLSSPSNTMATEHPEAIVDGSFLQLSGTSMAAAVTSGAVALLLQAHPDLNPDQVKYRLMATARAMGQPGSGAGLLNVWSAINSSTTETANTGTEASQLLWTGEDAVNWGSVNWGSVNWGSVNWGSVNWGSVNWGSVNWGSVNWGY